MAQSLFEAKQAAVSVAMLKKLPAIRKMDDTERAALLLAALQVTSERDGVASLEKFLRHQADRMRLRLLKAERGH